MARSLATKPSTASSVLSTASIPLATSTLTARLHRKLSRSCRVTAYCHRHRWQKCTTATVSVPLARSFWRIPLSVRHSRATLTPYARLPSTRVCVRASSRHWQRLATTFHWVRSILWSQSLHRLLTSYIKREMAASSSVSL